MSKKSNRQIPAARSIRPNEINTDYSTTKRELRRIAVIAAVILVVLVVLAIFQQPILDLFIK